MINVFLKEFKALLRNIVAASCIALLAMVSGVLLLINNLNMSYGGAEAILSFMTLMSALFIPPVAACAITGDRKSGQDAFYKALPLTTLQIVLGKFFAVFSL